MVKMAQQGEPRQPGPCLPKEPRVAVKVRERASRRAVKQTVAKGEAEARAHPPASPCISPISPLEPHLSVSGG